MNAHNPLEEALAQQPPSFLAVKEAVEWAYAEGMTSAQVGAYFPTRRAWERFRRAVFRHHGGFRRPPGLGVVVKDQMWPVHAGDQEHPYNQAVRTALAAEGRAWGVVWSFRGSLREPREIGSCGMRSRAGFFTCAYRPADPVVRKYQPVDD